MVTNQPSMLTNNMLIPLNTRTRNDLCLSIIRIGDSNKTKSQVIYSVAIVSIINGLGMDSLPSYCCDDLDDENSMYAPVVYMEDYRVVEGRDLYDCIEKCKSQIRDLL